MKAENPGIVVIGASTGGVAALQAPLDNLQPDQPGQSRAALGGGRVRGWPPRLRQRVLRSRGTAILLPDSVADRLAHERR